ncbi:MAG TPA: TatD family hydrolase [Solirubrobacterales bacterium]|nr:TatD family hydrolase [Solirubrobacterales bacterium]
MIDSHTHLFLCDRPEDELVEAALAADVTRMLNVGLGGEQNDAAIAGAERHEAVFAAVGRHPTEAAGFDDAEAERIAALAAHEKVRAIGETGIDYYRETASPADQRRAFEAQVAIAVERGLPIVIHGRDKDGETAAIDEIFELLDAQAGDTPVILHCFSAPWRAADAAERGWFCSFAGHTTYPTSAALREAAAQLPPELILVETDAPYLTPQPARGKPNEPAYVVETARVVAEARGIPYEELDELVEANARALFGW